MCWKMTGIFVRRRESFFVRILPRPCSIFSLIQVCICIYSTSLDENKCFQHIQSRQPASSFYSSSVSAGNNGRDETWGGFYATTRRYFVQYKHAFPVYPNTHFASLSILFFGMLYLLFSYILILKTITTRSLRSCNTS